MYDRVDCSAQLKKYAFFEALKCIYFVYHDQFKVWFYEKLMIQTAPCGQVVWGKISMIDAERRLLGNALKDPDNMRFVLISDRS